MKKDPPHAHASRRFLLGLVCLLVALVCSAALARWSAALPGCGPQSACARASASAWGRVPLLGWKTAELGLVYFAALTCAWVLARGVLSRGLIWIVRAGALVSLLLVGALAVERALCPWCLAVHAANLTFAALAARAGAERVATGTRSAGSSAALAFLLVFVTGGVLVSVAEARRRESERISAEREVERTTAEVRERSAEALAPAAAPFTGRWRLGPELARVRIVVFSDYQCPDCRRVESELQSLLARQPDVSLSAKHYPFCSDCNDVARELSFNPHPNACRAARLAEAAGMAGGEAAFWGAHRWLFERSGTFGPEHVEELARELGLDASALAAAMEGEESLARVRADIAEGTALGLRMTPFVFLNGVEFAAWTRPGALAQAVDELVAGGLPAASAAADRPPSAETKYFVDWRDGPRRSVATRDRHHWQQADTGPALVEAVVWGDYGEPNTRALDGELGALLAERPLVRYSFRHYPLDQACNPLASETVHPGACGAARLAEAAARVGGPEAFWRMHRWLMEHEARGMAALQLASAELGLDAEALRAALREPAVLEAPAEDARDGAAAGLTSVPYLLVDGRHVPRWKHEGDELLAHILDHALEQARSAQPK